MGIGGLVVAALVVWLMGGNPLSVLTQADLGSMITQQSGGTYEPTAEEEALAKFSSQILAGTEDVWAKEFKKMGKTYQPPRLVLFTGSVQSACGGASSSMGPFYCSADQSVYIDLSFFSQMKKQLGADGDFAYAYVIAHEVGHHVQYLLGILDSAHQQMSRVSEKESNRISVRLELQADYFAGIWAYHDNQMFNSLENGDIEEGLNVASKIGDDYLQKQAQGYTVPDAFNHGTSAQRVRWLRKGLNSGNVNGGDTFSPAYSDL
jgi:predicted metalloprotease